MLSIKQLKYIFYPSRWKAYLIYLLKKLLVFLDGTSSHIELWEFEQYHLRYFSCTDCIAAKKCIRSDCQCKMPERAYVRTDNCPKLKWGPFKKTKKQWEEYKLKNNIVFPWDYK